MIQKPRNTGTDFPPRNQPGCPHHEYVGMRWHEQRPSIEYYLNCLQHFWVWGVLELGEFWGINVISRKGNAMISCWMAGCLGEMRLRLTGKATVRRNARWVEGKPLRSCVKTNPIEPNGTGAQSPFFERQRDWMGSNAPYFFIKRTHHSRCALVRIGSAIRQRRCFRRCCRWTERSSPEVASWWSWCPQECRS